jgi:glycerophosphoryl diester phosphodiesterase
LPEHSLPAKALAYAMGADFLEQDIVATRDDQLVVLHDIYLDRVSNVADAFPGRARADGRFYVRDLDLAELDTLVFGERRNADHSPVYPNRFPVGRSGFHIHTFRDELAFLRELNRDTGGHVGCYPEIKRPAWHKEQGVDITKLFLADLHAHGYVTASDNVFVQCFDAEELRRIRDELHCEIKLIQLIGENAWNEGPTDFDALKTRPGLEQLAQTVVGIGPWIEQLYVFENGEPKPSPLARNARHAGLLVHPYTFRKDDLPRGFDEFSALLEFAFSVLEVDGLFTDFADLVRNAVDARA